MVFGGKTGKENDCQSPELKGVDKKNLGPKKNRKVAKGNW